MELEIPPSPINICRRQFNRKKYNDDLLKVYRLPNNFTNLFFQPLDVQFYLLRVLQNLPQTKYDQNVIAAESF
jgi:hypothetical protein